MDRCAGKGFPERNQKMKSATFRERNTGLDLLRCLSMFFVIVLHLFNHGGLGAALETAPVGKAVSTLVQVATYPAVDCFVLLSGYLLCKRSFRLARVTRIWCTVAFWSVVIQCVFYLLGLETVSLGKTVFMFLPVLSGRYWFVNAYIVMLLASPFLNRLLRDLLQWQMRALLLVSTVIFCLAPIPALGNDVFGTQNGFGFPWFCVLYLWGGYVNIYSPSLENNNGRYLGFYAILCLMHTVWILGVDFASGSIPALTQLRNIFMKYTSVPVFGSAICLLMYFKGMEDKPASVVARLCGRCSPLVFSAYLIHDHPLVREYWTMGRFARLGDLQIGFAVICAILAAVGIFAVCIVLDWCRERLFYMLKIPAYSDRISRWMTKKIVVRLKGDL